MTSKQFHKAAAALIRRYHPEKEEATTLPRWQCFTFPNGIEISIHDDWVHIGLFKVGEELGRKISSSPFKSDCWWKWNICLSWPLAQVREETFAELKRRLDKLTQFFPEMKPKP